MTQPTEPSDADEVTFGNPRRSQAAGERSVAEPVGPAEPVEPVESVGPSRPAMNATRWALVAMGIVTATALITAVLALTSDDDAELTALPVVESHGLTEEQAACLRFALVESRFAATAPTGTPRFGLSGRWVRALDSELAALDTIAAHYPGADYRIIGAVGDVADESAGLLSGQATATGTLSSAVDDRQEAVNRADDLCLDVADFDTVELAPAG